MEELISKVSEFMKASGQDIRAHETDNFEHFCEHLDLINLYQRLVVEENAEVTQAFIVGHDRENELKEICDLIWVLIGYTYLQGYDLSGAFNEVYRSNMSKIDPNTGVVIKNNQGKVIKPPTYSPANMSDFIVITENVQ